MKSEISTLLGVAGVLLSTAGYATGLATCDSGAPSSWQPQEKLTKMLTDRGWTVRQIKIDGGCYEAYVITDKGERMEAYFHPQTLTPVPTNLKR